MRWVWLSALAMSFTLGEWYFWSRSRPYVGDDFVQQGDFVGEITAVDKKLRKFSSFDFSHTMVLYSNIVNPKSEQAVVYASSLAKHYAPQASDTFQIMVSTGGSYPNLEKLQNLGQVSLPVVNDARFEIARRLHLARSHDGTVVLDQSGRVVFSAPLLVLPEDIRELYERYTLGTIHYENAQTDKQELVGSTFPNVNVHDFVHSGAGGTLPATAGNGQAYWLITANCPVCSLETIMDVLSSPAFPERVVPVFSASFPLTSLQDAASRRRMQRRIFAATSEIPGFEEGSSASGGGANVSYLILVSEDHSIRWIRPLAISSPSEMEKQIEQTVQ